MKNPEFFTITEMGPILMIMGTDTVIREMETGQMPMEIYIVPGMTKVIIPETNWNSMNFRANGTVNVIETTNGDYYYRDADGVGYTDNGDGTWTDENGNIYTE